MKAVLEYMAAVVLAWALIVFVCCIMAALLLVDIYKGVRDHVFGAKA